MRRTTIAAAVGPLVLCLLVSACGGSQAEDPPVVGSTLRAGTPHTLAKVLLLDFEHAEAPLRAGDRVPSGLSNGPRGEVVMAGHDAPPLRLVTGRDGTGQALEFPSPCPAAQEKTCPKEIIELYPDASLASGTADFEWGASLRLKKNETAKGSNIVQKGFSLGGGSQWKLQVDGDEGHPSCVLVGINDTDIHEVFADGSVADGAWHDVVCRRKGDELVVTVDGSHSNSVLIPKDLTIAPPGPVRIGGKDLKPNNDQFFGTVDDVFVSVPR